MHIQCLSKCHLLFLVGPFWYVTISPLSPRLWHESGPARPICGEPANINKSLHGRSVLTLNPNAPGLVYACLSQVIGYSEAQHTSGGQSTYRKPNFETFMSFFVESPNLWTQGTHLGNWKLRDTQWVILLQTVVFFFCPRLLSLRQLFP